METSCYTRFGNATYPPLEPISAHSSLALLCCAQDRRCLIELRLPKRPSPKRLGTRGTHLFIQQMSMPAPEGRHFKCSVYIAHPLPSSCSAVNPQGLRVRCTVARVPFPGPLAYHVRVFSQAFLPSLGRRHYSSLFLHISAK